MVYPYINSIKTCTQNQEEDIVCSNEKSLANIRHVHKIINSSVLMQVVRNGRVVEHKKHLLITGSYLKYGGYAQTLGLPPSKLGSPKVKFFSDKHDISISW